MVEIFSEVRAVLSSTVVGAISGSVEDTLRKHLPSTSILKVMSENNMQYCLLGTLEEIIAANSELQNMINSFKYAELSAECHFTFPIARDKENNYLLNQNTISSHKSSSSETPIEKDPSVINSLCELKRKTCIKKLRFHLRERPRTKQRNNALKSIHRHRYPKRKHVLEKRMIAYDTEPDSDALIRNLEEMKLSTENSSDGDNKLSTIMSKENFLFKKNKDYEASSPYKYFCELCSFKSKRSSHFAKHMSIHEKVNTLYKCSHCPFTSVRLSHLRRHEMTHSSTVHTCSQCHYKTDDEKFLSRHVRLKHCSVHNKDKKFSLILNCPHCSYHTTKQHYFERHQRMHCAKEKSFLHQCEKCCYKTHRKEHFVRHMNNVHSNKRPYLCHLCGKTFKRGDALQQHHQTHTETKVSETMNFKCDICEKNFRSHSHLGEHKAVHSEERSFLCEICGASFKTRSVQRKHVTTIHTKPRAFVCSACPKRFNTLYALKRHQKVHSGKAHTEAESEAEVDEPIKCFENTDHWQLKEVRIEPVAQELHIGTATSLDATVSLETLAVDTVPVQPTVLSNGAEVIQQVTPSFFQPSENTTTLLYLTNGLVQF